MMTSTKPMPRSVLGNTVLPDGTPSARLESAARPRRGTLPRRSFPLVIASGGTGKEGFDEATVMKNYLVAHGIPAENVIADNQGTTTYASAINTLRILRGRKLASVLVVSQYFHVPRAKLGAWKKMRHPYGPFLRMPIISRRGTSTPRAGNYSVYIEYEFRSYGGTAAEK